MSDNQLNQLGPLINIHESGDLNLAGQRKLLGDMLLGPAIGDFELDGVEINQAAVDLNISIDDIWKRIRNGQLVARTHRGKVYVYSDYEKSRQLNSEQPEVLPPLPSEMLDTIESYNFSSSDLATSEVQSQDLSVHFDPNHEDQDYKQNVALMIHHLNLAKEENRDIIRFTTEAMTKLTQMSDAMIKLKDSLIISKDEALEEMTRQVNQSSAELQRLARENEKLATVAKFLENDAF
ncbi:MAG: hypothetical protein NT027_08625 [Proteobacteria bacterium]|nr:hypothetical protein [Pseudomonadota bacterium]